MEGVPLKNYTILALFLALKMSACARHHTVSPERARQLDDSEWTVESEPSRARSESRTADAMGD